MTFTFIKSAVFAFVVVASGANALDQDATSVSLRESAPGELYDRSCTSGCIYMGRPGAGKSLVMCLISCRGVFHRICFTS